jgi:hypothetical protein
MFKTVLGMFMYGSGCIIPIIIYGIAIAVGGFFWWYSLNTWLLYFGKATIVLWWQAAIIGAIPGVGQFSLIIAFITWIAMLFIL